MLCQAGKNTEGKYNIQNDGNILWIFWPGYELYVKHLKDGQCDVDDAEHNQSVAAQLNAGQSSRHDANQP